MKTAMNKIFGRTKLIFVGLFALAVAGVWGYHYFYVWPGERCKAMGRWWAAEERVCGVPISVMTGLPLSTSPATAPATPAPAEPAAPPTPIATPAPAATSAP